MLELGSGTGVVGLAAALLGAHVTLTDLPHLLPGIRRNVEVRPLLIVMKCCALLQQTQQPRGLPASPCRKPLLEVFFSSALKKHPEPAHPCFARALAALGASLFFQVSASHELELRMRSLRACCCAACACMGAGSGLWALCSVFVPTLSAWTKDVSGWPG